MSLSRELTQGIEQESRTSSRYTTPASVSPWGKQKCYRGVQYHSSPVKPKTSVSSKVPLSLTWCFAQTARQVGITLSFAFQGAERHETLPNDQKRGSRVTRCAILETRERLRGKGKPKTVEVSVGPVGQGYRYYSKSSLSILK